MAQLFFNRSGEFFFWRKEFWYGVVPAIRSRIPERAGKAAQPQTGPETRRAKTEVRDHFDDDGARLGRADIQEVDTRIPADDETSSIFAGVLGLIDATLTGHYRVPKADAAQLEEELLSWFQRFSRRPGSPKSAQGLRPQLLLMACQAGHVYWSGRLQGQTSQDERLNRSLALGPQEIAIELERVFEETGEEKNS